MLNKSLITSQVSCLTQLLVKPLETIIAMKYTEAISSLISKGLNEINHSDKGHLSLSTRRAILQAINDPLAIGRISILCALKVYPIWNEFFKDDTEIIGLIKNTEKFLLGQTDKNELLSNADHLDVFADNYMEDNITASFAAKVAVQAAYDVGSDADMVISDYDSDEEIEDPDEWDTAFLASLVYNGGIVDWDSIDDGRNKEFWNWYLTECLSTAFDKKQMLTNDYKIERPIYKTPEQPRTQIHEYVNNDKVISLFSQLEKIFIEILSDIKGDTLIFDAYRVDTCNYAKVSYYKDGLRLDLELDICVLLYINEFIRNIKDEMYETQKDEGGFYELKMTINKNGDFIKEFNYDVRVDALQKKFYDFEFVNDFKAYPRTKKFIPDWLADILKRKRINF